MQTTSKIAIIGLGYWGQIIYNNLRDMGYSDIITYDEFKPSASSVNSLNEINAEYIFVCVTTSEHYRICEHFLKIPNTKVFCEKPLTDNTAKSRCLLSLTETYQSYLFVDWLFTFNDQVNYIKQNFFVNLSLGQPLNINMNRLNKGPERYDTNAMHDLASHDVSILQHWFEKPPDKADWISYRRNKQSIQDDSCIGILKFGDATVQINCSWEHNLKDRLCILSFKEGIVVWNDINQEIKVNSKEEPCISQHSPIHNSISAFMSGSIQQNIITENTLAIEETLNATRLSIR